MARPTASTRVRKIAAHVTAGAVAATNYDDDYTNTTILDKAIANDNTERDRLQNTANGTLSVTGLTFQTVDGVGVWA